MTPLEYKRLAALGHTSEQITAITEYEQAVKREFASTLKDLLVNRVPDREYVGAPGYIKSKIREVLTGMTK